MIPSSQLDAKLVSGQNIKTIAGNDLTGSGNIAMKTFQGDSLFGAGNIVPLGNFIQASTIGINGSMASAPLGSICSFEGLGNASYDWPLKVTSTNYYWVVLTIGLANRTMQIAMQIYSGITRQGYLYSRAKHDSTWSAWAAL